MKRFQDLMRLTCDDARSRTALCLSRALTMSLHEPPPRIEAMTANALFKSN